MGMIKTPEQISQWLGKQKWIRKFVRNIRDVGQNTKETARKILAGQYKADTIAAGFDWGRSPQGHDYWYKRHKEFNDWYYG